MGTFVLEPDIRLGGRYLLKDQCNASRGWESWKAIDERFGRAVSILTLACGFPRIGETVAAACAASRLTDSRLARVFDVAEGQDRAYVVMEWASGDSLDEILASGPLDPRSAAEIIAQSAQALASAHAAGVPHLCLNPRSLRWTADGGVRITGLGIDAALAGVTAADPALADTQALARLLYAALTAHWPGGTWPSLPPAPAADGTPYRPRQVRAGVPAGLDELCCQVLFPSEPGRHHHPPVTTPALLATALSRAIPARAVSHGYVTAVGRCLARARRRRPRRGGAVIGRPPLAAWLLASVAAVLLTGALVTGIWGPRHHGGREGPGRTCHSLLAAMPVWLLKPAAAYSPGRGSPDCQPGLLARPAVIRLRS